MKLRHFPLVILLVFALACNFVTRAFSPFAPPTQTPTPLTPAYIPPDCASASLATVPAATALAVPTPAIQANPQIDHALQSSVFEKVVKIITDVYVYPDFNGKDWPGIVASYRTKIQSGLDTETFYSDMQSMVDELGDDHSSFLSPVDVAASDAELSGNTEYVGVGVSILPELDKGKATILQVFPDSPADHVGLKPHDDILSADGLPLVENGESYIYRARGPECSAVRLTVESPGGTPHDLLLVRHKIEGDIPIDSRLVTTTDGSRIGYILLPSFFDEKIPSQVYAALKNFGQLDGLILDNRENSGGSSDVVEPILSFFTSGTLGEFKNRRESRPLAITPNPIKNSQTVPLVVLVGTDTVSFGEIFSGVIKDSGRGKIVGQTTLGNVEILHGYNFDDGSRLWIAEETFDPAVSHANWEQTGIVPDVQAYATWDTFTFDTDPAVLAAVKLLGHK